MSGGGEAEAKKHGKRKKNRNDKKAKTRADASCPGPSGDGVGLSIAFADVRLAQTFTAFRSGRLLQTALQIDKSEGSFGDYVLQLGAVDTFGVPTNEVLAATTVANGSVPVGETLVPFTFAQPAAVVAGKQYALVLTRPGSDRLFWRGHFGDSCGGRSFNSGNLTVPFKGASIDLDLIFTTFVRS